MIASWNRDGAETLLRSEAAAADQAECYEPQSACLLAGLSHPGLVTVCDAGRGLGGED